MVASAARMRSFAGRLTRGPFALGIVAAGAVFWLGIRASEAALPWLAEVLAPRGINAGLALNMIWLALGLLLVCALLVLGANRLRDRGRSPWWALAAVLPLAILALINDAIFLVSKSFVLPPAVNWALLLASGAVALWLLAECLICPSQDREAR